MAHIYKGASRTFNEYLLMPNLTTRRCTPANISLKTPLVRFKKGDNCPLQLNIPIVSAVMNSVSDDNMAIALAKCGGLSFIHGSQPISRQAEMVRKVKKHKAGFVISDSNMTPENTLADLVALKDKTGHSTIAVTEDGLPNGKLAGIIASRDCRIGHDPPETKIKNLMTPFSRLVVAKSGISLIEANDIIWDNKINCLPIVDERQDLKYLVFRKDYEHNKQNKDELLDISRRLIAGAGINTRDYEERVPELVKAGADILCVDSSDGYSEWQRETIDHIRQAYHDKVKVGGGNVIDREGFLYLAESGADFVKIGIGGGSICITREQKGIGRGQATAIIEVAAARDEYYKETGTYVPLCSDGGIVHDYHIALALAMGADFVMMGRYFARFDESPAKKITRGNGYLKEYWGEGSSRGRNWQRYDLSGSPNLKFEEGVDGYVPYAGKMKDNLDLTLNKIRSTMSSCGAATIREFQKNARLALVSSTSIIEGGAHDIILKENDY